MLKYLYYSVLFLLGFIIVGCNQSTDVTAVKAEKEREAIKSYEIVETWKPYDHPNGFGAKVILNEDLSEADLIAFVKFLASDHDPVSIDVYTSRKAFLEASNNNYTEAYDSDYILFYVKNLSVKRTFYGFNEIRWMQSVGKFSDKFGTVTKLQD